MKEIEQAGQCSVLTVDWRRGHAPYQLDIIAIRAFQQKIVQKS
jgi:hypothetical protein